jgi:ABC-type multidrug transport system ATPase subunit
VRGSLVAIDQPEALRRAVFGGEVVDVRTRGDAHPKVLTRVPGVIEVRQRSKDRVIVIADDAATTVPRIVDAMQDAGDRVLSAEKYEPSFDDVFVALVEQSGVEDEVMAS